jgi:hypothetical protein
MSNYALVWRGGDGLQPVVDCVKLSDADFNAVTAIIKTVQEQEPPSPLAAVKMMVCATGGVNLRADHSPTAVGLRLLKYGEAVAVDEFWIPGNSALGAWAHIVISGGPTGWAAITYSGGWYLRTI